MASTIKIKRSEVSGNPSVLAAGELAYSGLADNGANGGDRLYVGMGVETNGNAANHVVIGGKYFTDKLDHAPGTLTAGSAIIVDDNKKIDQLLVDNLEINGNAISATNTNGNLVLNSNGTGQVSINDNYTLPNLDGTAGQVLVTDGNGSVTFQDPASSAITLTGNTGSDVLNTGETLNITGSNSISTTVTDNSVDITVADATNLIKGIASFSSNSFSVTNGAVTIKAGGVTNTQLVNSDVTIGNTTIALGDSATTLTGLTSVTSTSFVGNLTGNADTATNATSADEALKLTTPRTITLAGDLSGNVSFDGSQNVTLTASVVANAIELGTDTTGDYVSGVTAGANTGISVTGTGEGAAVVVSGVDATTTSKGVASFAGTTFSVTNGAVDIKAGGVSNSQLANSKVTLGSTDLTLGTTVTDVAGLTSVIVDTIKIDGNEITSTDTNGNISLKPTGSGHIAANGFNVKDLADPVDPQDAATKAYVDNAVTGLDWKMAVHLLSAVDVPLTGNTNTVTIDGHATLTSVHSGYRILLTGQSIAANNGIYDYTDNGTTYTFTRSADADTYQELIGTSVYVMEGTAYGATGWVQSSHYLTSFSGQNWVQFSGAGAYTAGEGLGQSGTTFFVNVAANGGIEISADSLQLKSSVAGNGLSYASGVLTVGGTADRISVSADAIDIASTYKGQASIDTVGTLTSGALGTGFTEVAVPQGGTGKTTLTSRGIVFGNGTSPVGVTAASTTNGSFLAEDSTGNPYWTNVIDGGTY